MNRSISSCLILIVFVVFFSSNLQALDQDRLSNTVSARGSISSLDIEPGGDTDFYQLYGKYGFFVEEIELAGAINYRGSNPGGSRNGFDQYTFSSEANYHFFNQSNTVPYAGVNLGFTTFDFGGNSSTTVSYGGQVGVKQFVNDTTSIDFELRLTKTEVDFGRNRTADVVNRELTVGISYWF